MAAADLKKDTPMKTKNPDYRLLRAPGCSTTETAELPQRQQLGETTDEHHNQKQAQLHSAAAQYGSKGQQVTNR